MRRKDNILSRLAVTVSRSFSEFLFIPAAQVAAFTALAFLTCAIDGSAGPKSQWGPIRTFLDRFTGDTSQATNLLSTVASSLVTVSSITFSILLLAVQQSSAALTNQIVDQYLRRRSNQWFFGFFVGSSVYALSSLGLTRNEAVPVLAASVSLVLAIACLMSLIILIYSTLDQTRPSSIIASIHDAALAARQEQLGCFASSRSFEGEKFPGVAICSEAFGYVTWIDAESLNGIAKKQSGCVIAVQLALGDEVYVGQQVATVCGVDHVEDDLRNSILEAVRIERRRDLRHDPCYGIEQLAFIGWTSISTAKSNPAAAQVAVHALNDLLFQWGSEKALTRDSNPDAKVVLRDRIISHLANSYESLIVVSSESMQHQSLAEILNGISRSYALIDERLQDALVERVVGALSSFGDHVATFQLEESVNRIARTFADHGKVSAAAQITAAWSKLRASRGTLHSRGDRVPS
jgi:uncharacterized membrane protein